MEKTTNSKIVYGIIPVFLLAIFGFTFFSFDNPFVPSSDSGVSTIQYDGYVCVYSTGEFEGRDSAPHTGVSELVGCKHNLLTNEGANAIRSILGNQVSFGNFTAIGLCNASNDCSGPLAAATGTTFESEFTNSASCGMNRTYGTYAALAQTGNWSVEATFTATCDGVETNKTGLFNHTLDSTGTLLAENTFSLVTLNSPDTLTVNWTITAQDGGA